MKPELVGLTGAAVVCAPTAIWCLYRVVTENRPPTEHWHGILWEIRYQGSFHEEGSSLRLARLDDYDTVAAEFLDEWLIRNNVRESLRGRYTCRVRPKNSGLWLGSAVGA